MSKISKKRLPQADPSVRTYTVHSMFETIQGEGYHAGKKAVFIRFSGCNIWSGFEEHRARDADKGACALICDTVFTGTDQDNGGGKFTAEEIALNALKLWGDSLEEPFIVLTGGEPSMQVDLYLVSTLQRFKCYVAMETNGSRIVPKNIDWVTLSPKPPMRIERSNHYSEVKVLFPMFDPEEFEELAYNRWVQPVDLGNPEDNATTMKACVQYVSQHPRWRLSMQLHKIAGIQ